MAHKLVLGIFICIFSFILMSDNVSAASQTYYLRYGVYTYGFPRFTGSQSGQTLYVLTGQQYNISNNVYVVPGDRVLTSAAFYLNSDKSKVDLSAYTDWSMSFNYCGDEVSFIPSSNDYWRLTDYYESIVIDRQFMSNISQTNNYNISSSTKCSNVFIKGKLPNNRNLVSFDLGTSSNGQFSRLFSYNNLDNDPSLSNLIIVDPTVVFYDNPNEAEEALEKEKQETQAAADASETAGDSAGSDAEATSQSLLSATGSVVSALAAAPATDCNIDMRTSGSSSSFTGAIGTINLCSNVPSGVLTFVQGLLALVLTPIVFYYCYHIVQYLINLFKEYQN